MRTSQGLALTMLILGGWLTHNLERIHKDIARITSDNVDPGVDWHTTWKGSMRTLQGLPLTMLIQGVNWHTTWKGSTRTLQGLPLTMLILGGVNRHTTWKGSVRTSQVLPLTMLIWGSINTQHGKVPWGHCKDYLWQCWSGVCVNQHTTWKGSMRTLQGLPLIMLILGGQLTHNLKGSARTLQGLPLTMLTLEGSINMQLGKDPWGHCKDYLWECWSWGSIDTQLGKDPQGHCKDYLWQCYPGWGQSTHNLERIHEDIARITSDNVDLGLNQHTTWKGSMRTLQGLPLTVLIWGCVSINTQLGRDPWGHCKDYLW